MLKREPWYVLHAAVCAAGSMVLLAGKPIAGLLLWAVGWAVILIRSLQRDGRHLGRHLGRWISTRLLLAVGPAGLVVAGRGETDWLALAAVAIHVVTVRTETPMLRVCRFHGLRTLNLSGLELPGLNQAQLAALAILQYIMLPLFIALAWFAVPGAVWLVCLVPSCILIILLLNDAVRRRRQSRKCREDLPKVLASLQPRFVLYWDAPKGSAFQIAMWLPYLKRAGIGFVIIVRNDAAFAQASRVSDGVPVVLAREQGELDNCIPDTVTTAFYVNNAARNSHLVRFQHLTHVQLLHGDSDKAPSFNPVTAMYDRIWVAGQAGIDRYAAHGVDIPHHKFEIVGRPQVEQIELRRGSCPDRPTVLYAPTWKGYFEDSAYSSLPLAETLFDHLLKLDASIIFRPHPYCRKDPQTRRLVKKLGQRLAEHTKQTGVQHYYGEIAEVGWSVTECFNRSDAMVADVSSVVADYLYSEKPFAIMAGDVDPEQFVVDFPLARGAHVLTSVDGLGSQLDEMLIQDPMMKTRQRLKTYYLGDFEAAQYAYVFITAVRREVLEVEEAFGELSKSVE